MNDLQRQLIEEKLSTVCRCGKEKARSQTFCRACYFSLPQPMRQALYRRISQGYEAAHAAAVAQLDGAK